LIIYTNPQEFKDFLFQQNIENTALLLMSSGNYGGLDFEELKKMV
jgi:UDP-N-acetylmuramate: L-alanyl-gamma-D-glutamyl-meso-diaminopimelate ligase